MQGVNTFAALSGRTTSLFSFLMLLAMCIGCYTGPLLQFNISCVVLQALDAVRQTKVAQLLVEESGSYPNSLSASNTSLNSSGKSLNDDKDDERKNGKREKTFSRLKRTLSSRGQRLMEKMGASGTRLQRSSSRDNLAQHAKLSPSSRISRSTPMLAQPMSDQLMERDRSSSVSRTSRSIFD